MDALSPMDFTATIFKKVRTDGPDVAQQWVMSYVKSGHIDEAHYRVTQGLAQIRDARAQEARFMERAAAKGDSPMGIYVAEPAKTIPIGGIPSRFWPTTPAGLYQTRVLSNPVSRSFSTLHLTPDDEQLFTESRFGDSPAEFHEDRVFVGKEVRLSATGWSEATAITGDGTYHPTRSGRLSRLTGRLLVAEESERSSLAYILPFPYVANNYYHSLSEMAYGLRHIHAVDNTVSIVYDLDPYGILPFVCRSLGIDPTRLVSRADAQGVNFKTAIMPDVAPYYWSGPFVNFFRSISLRERTMDVKGRRIYISRSKSSRSLECESAIEGLVASYGFEVIHAEALTFAQQVDLFQAAEMVIAPHGAGLANMCFVPDRCQIIEIFVEELVNRDFQMRSQYVTASYTPLYLDGNNPDRLIGQLRTLLDASIL
ncbi:glycosyltransferase family 61 protein [Brachybacterium squillarum]|uniref:glycosyltransferase family 61 protein n=1 Tax=Brachybacterium squillarum TaxID=661979 RepID=UPI002222F254|nr:glycosyltransferase family 61 protein [Brachybacterium squillarum]MCW1805160.1 glycosyltransferase family 61 protein [Brachybacterium squillarum]